MRVESCEDPVSVWWCSRTTGEGGGASFWALRVQLAVHVGRIDRLINDACNEVSMGEGALYRRGKMPVIFIFNYIFN